ncbi:MAG: site-specific integrase [Planctomycetota bacterium]
MASIVNYSGGLKRIDFAPAPNAPRKTIRLGRVSSKVAEAWKAKIESIIADRLARRPHDAETSKWLGQMDDAMLSRLRAAGLAEGVGTSQATLGDFLAHFFETMHGKPATRVFYGHTRRNLEEHFTTTRPIRSITAADADGFRAWLAGANEKTSPKLAPATVARRIIAARTMWRRAIRWKLASENAFDGIKAGHQRNDTRKAFIPREVIDRVIAEAPDTEWKTIIALCRYGGLRTPSEPYALRWGDVDFHRGTIRVTCPKLAHIEKCAHRIIPLFPELRGLLLQLFAEAPDGTEYVIAKHRLGSLNLGQHFERIIRRTGATPWPRLFHNLRASRETELMREYDLATVCKWIGNSPTIAAEHYATSVDLNADFRRATDTGQAQQNVQQSPAVSGGPGRTGHPKPKHETPENIGNVHCGTFKESSVHNEDWAIQDSNL